MHSFLTPLSAELNSIWHLLALLGVYHILHVSRVRVNVGIDGASCPLLMSVSPKQNGRRVKLDIHLNLQDKNA